jgi:hypothetical protein
MNANTDNLYKLSPYLIGGLFLSLGFADGLYNDAGEKELTVAQVCAWIFGGLIIGYAMIQSAKSMNYGVANYFPDMYGFGSQYALSVYSVLIAVLLAIFVGTNKFWSTPTAETEWSFSRIFALISAIVFVLYAAMSMYNYKAASAQDFVLFTFLAVFLISTASEQKFVIDGDVPAWIRVAMYAVGGFFASISVLEMPQVTSYTSITFY